MGLFVSVLTVSAGVVIFTIYCKMSFVWRDTLLEKHSRNTKKIERIRKKP